MAHCVHGIARFRESGGTLADAVKCTSYLLVKIPAKHGAWATGTHGYTWGAQGNEPRDFFGEQLEKGTLVSATEAVRLAIGRSSRGALHTWEEYTFVDDTRARK